MQRGSRLICRAAWMCFDKYRELVPSVCDLRIDAGQDTLHKRRLVREVVAERLTVALGIAAMEFDRFVQRQKQRRLLLLDELKDFVSEPVVGIALRIAGKH